jgi:hypothetical protein
VNIRRSRTISSPFTRRRCARRRWPNAAIDISKCFSNAMDKFQSEFVLVRHVGHMYNYYT